LSHSRAVHTKKPKTETIETINTVPRNPTETRVP
jgi:hypothetical protein